MCGCSGVWLAWLSPCSLGVTGHWIQIRLADGSVVFSERVGSVHFNPVVNGQEMAPLEVTNVFYVLLYAVIYFLCYSHSPVFETPWSMRQNRFLSPNLVQFPPLLFYCIHTLRK